MPREGPDNTKLYVISVSQIRPSGFAYQDPEEAKDMDDQYYSFNQRKLLGEESVEENGDGCHGDDHECCMPCGGDIIWVVQDDDSLDLSSH